MKRVLLPMLLFVSGLTVGFLIRDVALFRVADETPSGNGGYDGCVTRSVSRS